MIACVLVIANLLCRDAFEGQSGWTVADIENYLTVPGFPTKVRQKTYFCQIVFFERELNDSYQLILTVFGSNGRPIGQGYRLEAKLDRKAHHGTLTGRAEIDIDVYNQGVHNLSLMVNREVVSETPFFIYLGLGDGEVGESAP